VHRQAGRGSGQANGPGKQVGTDPAVLGRLWPGGCWLCHSIGLLDSGPPKLIAALPEWCC